MHLLFTRLKDNALIIMALMLGAAYGLIKILRSSNANLRDEVRHYEIKEEADELRNAPVVHDKSDILDRM